MVFFLLFVILSALLFAQTSLFLPQPDQDPFLGTWKANAEKSRPKLDKVGASYVITISRDGDDRVISSRMKKRTAPPLIKGKTYSEFRERHYRIRCDGLLYPVPSGALPITMSCTYKAANRVEGETHMECPKGETCQFQYPRDTYWTQEVSSDGQLMTVSVYTDRARTKLRSAGVHDRVK